MSGELYVFASTLLWSMFPVVSLIIGNKIPPLLTGTLSIGFSVILFAFVLTAQKKWHEIKIKKAWKDVLLLVLFNGLLFYGLVFVGVQNTTAGNASIMLQMEVLFTMLILKIWKNEKLTKLQYYGCFLMFIGALVIVLPKQNGTHIGDLLILIATFFPAFGNYYAKEARKKIGSNTILFLRGIVNVPILIIISLLIEKQPSSEQLSSSLLFLIFNGVFIFGLSKIFWTEAIHRIPITKAISLSLINPLLTMIFAWFLLHEVPSVWQILGFIPIAGGIYLLTKKSSKLVEIGLENK